MREQDLRRGLVRPREREVLQWISPLERIASTGDDHSEDEAGSPICSGVVRPAKHRCCYDTGVAIRLG